MHIIMIYYKEFTPIDCVIGMFLAVVVSGLLNYLINRK
jgi:hypothetical protein